MRTNPRNVITNAKHSRRPVVAATTAAVFGVLIGGASSVMGAQGNADAAQTSDVQSYPAPGATGDRGVESVYRAQRNTSVQAEQGVQSAPPARTAGDRGANQPQYGRGEEVYMGRMSRRAAGETRMTVGDRGVNQPYTMRNERTQLDINELQDVVDDLQSMYDDAQARLDERQVMLDEARWNAAAGTAGNRGINRVYRPEQSVYYVPEYSGDSYQAPAPGTYGDRGVNRVYRDERTYRERAAHERSGRNVDLYGVGGMTLPESQAELDAISERLDELQTQLDEQQVRAGPRTSGDRGVNRIWRDPTLDRRQSRLDREQRLLDRRQRKVDRLQRKLDRQVERHARMSSGDRGMTKVAEPGQAPSVQKSIEQLFSQLDQDGNEMLSATEAKRLVIVERNLTDLDEDGDGNLTLSEFRSIVDESEAL